MTVSHSIHLFRAAEGDLGESSLAIFDADDDGAVAQAKSLIASRRASASEAALKPTQGILSRVDGFGVETPFLRLFCAGQGDVREAGLDTPKTGTATRSEQH